MSDQPVNEQKADLAQEILNRILTDAEFRQQLLDNPAETLSQAGYIEGDDVSGYFMKMAAGSLLGARPLAVNPTPPIPAGSTAINCGGGGGGGGGTTAINCGGGGSSGAIPKPKPKPPVYPNDPTNR